MKRPALLVLVLVLSALSVSAQEAEPYDEDEFPEWALDLRRAEIIALGAYPIAYLFTTLMYDLFRFGRESVRSGAVASQYAPLFFAPPDAPGYTREERRGVFIASLSVSATVALLDYLLGRAERSEDE